MAQAGATVSDEEVALLLNMGSSVPPLSEEQEQAAQQAAAVAAATSRASWPGTRQVASLEDLVEGTGDRESDSSYEDEVDEVRSEDDEVHSGCSDEGEDEGDSGATGGGGGFYVSTQQEKADLVEKFKLELTKQYIAANLHIGAKSKKGADSAWETIVKNMNEW